MPDPGEYGMTRGQAGRFPLLLLAYLGPLLLTHWPARQAGRAADAGTDAERTSLQWHAWQGFLLAVIETVTLVCVGVLAGYTVLANVAAGVTLGVLAWILWCGVLAVHLAAVLAALAGRRLELPILGRLATRLAREP